MVFVWCCLTVVLFITDLSLSLSLSLWLIPYSCPFRQFSQWLDPFPVRRRNTCTCLTPSLSFRVCTGSAYYYANILYFRRSKCTYTTTSTAHTQIETKLLIPLVGSPRTHTTQTHSLNTHLIKVMHFFSRIIYIALLFSLLTVFNKLVTFFLLLSPVGCRCCCCSASLTIPFAC